MQEEEGGGEGRREAEEEEEEELETEDKVPLLTAEYLGVKDEWELTTIEGPTYQSFQDRIQREQELYFYPSMVPGKS